MSTFDHLAFYGITVEEVRRVIESPEGYALGSKLTNGHGTPSGWLWGRVVRDQDGTILLIEEARPCTEEEAEAARKYFNRAFVLRHVPAKDRTKPPWALAKL